MDRVRLKFKSISDIVGSEEIVLLILTDEAETRQLAISCDRAMMREFSIRRTGVPVAGRLLPEVLWHVVCTQTDLDFEIFIAGIMEGQYQALLVNTRTLEPVAIRASDAVLLSYIGHIPISIDRTLMEKQSAPYNPESRGVAVPMNTVSTEMLQSALDKAVEDEKYELASILRDEIMRRNR